MTREELTHKWNSYKGIIIYPTDNVKELINATIEELEKEPKTGHWIPVTNGRGGHECDICHNYAPSYQTGDEYLTKRCPNCGARMESEE